MTSPFSTRLHLPSLGYVRINFHDIAATAYRLYESAGEIARQNRIRHLGLIAEIYPGTHHTRWEYAALQCAIIDIIERVHKDNPEIGPGSLQSPDGSIKGSELLKTWVLLGNFGHCANTFADEKAILSRARDNRDFRSELVALVPDSELRTYTRSVLDRYDYPNFHWCLAAARIPLTLNKHSRDKRPLVGALRLALGDRDSLEVNQDKLTQLRLLHRLVRKLAIVCIDAQNSHVPVQFDLGAAILSMDLSEHRLIGQTLELLVDSLLSTLADSLYTDPDVIATIRSYELQSAPVLERLDAKTAIEAAAAQGLIEDFHSHLRHSHRQTIPATEDPSLFDQQNLAERLLRNTQGIHASVDENPFRSTRHVDFLIEQRGFKKSEIGNAIYAAARNFYNVTRIRVRHALSAELEDAEWWRNALQQKGVSQDAIDDSVQEYMSLLDERISAPSIIREGCASVVRSVIDLIFESRYSVTMDPGVDHIRYYGLWMIHPTRGGWIDHGSRAIQEALERETDPSRINEIELVRQQKIPTDAWFYLVCFGPLLIMDFSLPPGSRRVTDIDGLSVAVAGNKVLIQLFEAKPERSNRTRNTPALTKLRKTVLPLVVASARPGYKTRSYVRGGKLSLEFSLA